MSALEDLLDEMATSCRHDWRLISETELRDVPPGWEAGQPMGGPHVQRRWYCTRCRTFDRTDTPTAAEYLQKDERE